ncbi:MAG: hypothetical protein ACLTZY_07375, partial [Alistipes indistinctus]
RLNVTWFVPEQHLLLQRRRIRLPGSKYDANANVENKNIATLIGELPKRNFIRLNRQLLCDRIKEMYGREMADKLHRAARTGISSTRTTRRAWPTTAPASRCTLGSSAGRSRSAATRPSRRT